MNQIFLTPPREKNLYNEILHLSPIGYFPMHEMNGAIALNHASRGRYANNGVITGVTIGQPGKFGKAFSFNKTNSDVNCGTGLELLSYTVGAIVKTGSDVTTSQMILSRGENGLDMRELFLFIQDGLFHAQRSDTASYPTINGIIPAVANTLYLLILTFDGTTGNIYVNGLLDISGSLAVNVSTPNATRITSIGSGYQWNGQGFFLGGLVQHAFFVDKVITPGQALRIARIAGFAA